MGQRIYVKVIGFSDVERHALNTVFRLSEEHATSYCLWEHDAPEPPQLALVDGQSYQAPVELASPSQADLKFIWVGEGTPPSQAWRSFQRPLVWTEVVQAMDALFAPPAEVDFDLDFAIAEADDAADTQPPDTQPAPPGKRALIASPDRDERLYLRAKLSLAGLTHADEAETGAQALELARAQAYDVALVNFGLPDMDGWQVLRALAASKPPVRHLIATKARASAGERVRGWWVGTAGFLDKPPHPGKLHELLLRV